MMTPVTALNTATDAFCWLCQLESKLLRLRAYLNAGIYLPYDEPGDDKDEEPAFECGLYLSGRCLGEFLEELESGDILPLTAAGKELLETLNHTGLALCAPVWEDGVDCGLKNARGNRAIYKAGYI